MDPGLPYSFYSAAPLAERMVGVSGIELDPTSNRLAMRFIKPRSTPVVTPKYWSSCSDSNRDRPRPERGGLPDYPTAGWCRREDSNLHAVASSRPSTYRVCQFHHAGMVPSEGFAPPSPPCKRGVLLLDEPGKIGSRMPESNRLENGYEPLRDINLPPAVW